MASSKLAEPTREIFLAISGLPPAKNEAISMLGAGHSHHQRVVALLDAARKAITEGSLPFGTERLGFELVVYGVVGPLTDATNVLGGVADVLENKARRGALEHLGDLSSVYFYENDRQIEEVHYRRVPDGESRYTVRLWLL
jgi:hypothetical protein